MKLFTCLLFSALLACGCKMKNDQATLKEDLKTKMQAYLYSANVNNDSSNIKYRVLDVTYFDDTLKKRYVCMFKVNLKENITDNTGKMKTHFDTTGQMEAYISKDFKKVTRLY